MAFLELHNLNKVYPSQDGQKRYALNNFSVIFPSSGLISIIGKSGSGKSTLLNMIGLLDKPDSGDIYFNNQRITNWKEKKKIQYRNKDIGIIFQHYHLLEDETVLFNVMLPMLILGAKEKDAMEDAKTLLEGIEFPKKLYEQKCADLSGGEKERVAILRALINNPKIILADEPTGALDSLNSVRVMEILKNASKNRLVILVSHNETLCRDYADRIITIKDGKLFDNKIVSEENNGVPVIKSPHRRSKSGWSSKISKTNFKTRLKRNLIASLSLAIGLTACMLIIGFSNGAKNSIAKETIHQLDYGALTFSKEIVKKVEGTSLSLVQTLRPSLEDIAESEETLAHYYRENNYDALLSGATFMVDGKEIEDFYYTPVYSFEEHYLDYSLLREGEFPTEDSLNEVMMNQKAYDIYLKNNHGQLQVKAKYEYHYYTGDDSNPMITDYLVYEKNLAVVGVVHELDFLSIPKIYYPFVSLDAYCQSTIMNNLSVYLDHDYSWANLLTDCESNSLISSYSYRLFLKDIALKEEISSDLLSVDDPLKINSQAITIGDTLLNLVNAATVGMEIFLVIALIGTALILGIVSFSSYTQDKRKSAILSCLGASNDEIMSIYVEESLIVGLISLVTSFVLAPVFALLINKIIYLCLKFSSMIVLPFARFMNTPLLFPFLCLFVTIFVCLLSTVLPIQFSKKISLKEELADE